MQKANLKASQVVVDDSDYRASHQKSPRGRGLWYFCAVDPRTYTRPGFTYLDHIVIVDHGLFGDAKRLARSHAAARGLRVIYVCA